MTDIKKLFKIIWKRFSIWIILLALLTVLFNSINASSQVESKEEYFRKSVETMAERVGVCAPSADKQLNKAYMDKAEEISKKYTSKYKLKYTKYSETESYYDFEDSNANNDYGNDFELLEPIQNYIDTVDFISNDGIKDYYMNNLLAPIIFFVLGLAFLITSLEQSLPYYEFTSMFPWKKQDEVWMKSLIAFLFGLAVLLINLLISTMILKSSAFSSIVDITNILSPIFKLVLLTFGASILSVSTGMIAGNFLGHIGLGIITVGGIDLIVQNIRSIISIFSPDNMYSLDTSYSRFKDSLPEFFKPFITLINFQFEYIYIVGFLVMALLIAILSYIVNQKISAEKSGYMIISKPIEKYTKILASFSFAALFYVILSDTLMNNDIVIINLIIYALGLLIGTKLFDILFKIRLKF